MSYSVLIILCGFGAIITLLNFYLSFVRYPIHRLFGGTREDYRWVSGLPVFGSAFLWLGAAFLTSQPTLMWSMLLLSLFDTAGLHWFIATIIWHVVLHKQRTNER